MIDPAYSLRVAAELIPMPSVAALYLFLGRNKDEFPPRYKVVGGPRATRGGHQVRILFESEILKIREMVYVTTPRSTGRPKSIINSIIAQATA